VLDIPKSPRRTLPVTVLLLLVLMTPGLGRGDTGAADGALHATNPSYQVSNSTLLRMPSNMLGWPEAPVPKPDTAVTPVDPTATEVFSVESRTITRLASDSTQAKAEGGNQTAPPYQGLLSPGFVPETVFPPDDRQRITPTTSYPWRTLVKLFITAADSSNWICSGALVDNFHALTAGHCVYMKDNGGWVSSIQVVPGYDNGYMSYNYAWATYLRSYSGWTDYQMTEHDWGLVTLDRNVGSWVGYLGRMTASSSDAVYIGTLNTAGYPGDLCSGECMYWDADSGRTATEYNHWYYMDTAGGQSGSPVWVYYSSSGSRYILTIHTNGDDGSGSNHGTRLNQDKYDRLNTWLSSDTPPTDHADLIDDGQANSGFDPTIVARGVTGFGVWSRVRNVGTTSSGGFYVSYYASTNTAITSSDYLIAKVYVSSISAFSYSDVSWVGTFPGGIPTGTYWVGWIIDSDNNVQEFDETNNVAYKSSYQLVVQNAQYTVTFYTDPTSGTITADSVTKTNGATGTYAANQRVHVIANPPSGYSFANWQPSGVAVDNQLAQDTYMIVSGSGSLKANFVQVKYTVTFYTDPTSGTITADSVTKTNGATGTYGSGARVHVIANSPSGCYFWYWETSGVSVDSTSSQDTYMTVSNNGWLKAHFKAGQIVYSVVRGMGNGIFYGGDVAGSWSGWTQLLPATSDSPAACVCGGLLHVAVRGTSGGVYYGYVTLSSGVFSGWTLIKSGLTPSAPGLAAASDCTLYLVVRGMSNGIFLATHTPGGAWSDWRALPGLTVDGPAVAVAGSTLHLVVRGTAGAIWHGRMDRGTLTWLGWSLLPGGTTSKPALAAASTELYLSVRGSSGAIFVNKWDGSGWVGWEAIPGSTGATPSGPAITVAGGQLYVEVQGMSNWIYWCKRSLPSGSWTNWTALQDGATPSSPALAS